MNRTIEIVIVTTGEIQIDAVGEQAPHFLEECAGGGRAEVEKV
jgi:hypothetical protein